MRPKLYILDLVLSLLEKFSDIISLTKFFKSSFIVVWISVILDLFLYKIINSKLKLIISFIFLGAFDINFSNNTLVIRVFSIIFFSSSFNISFNLLEYSKI